MTATIGAEPRAATLMRVLDQLATGAISVVVTALDGLERAPEAQQALAEGRGDTKYVIRVADGDLMT